MTLCLAEDENIYYKESDIPEKHYDPKEGPDNIRTDRQTTAIIEKNLVDDNSKKLQSKAFNI